MTNMLETGGGLTWTKAVAASCLPRVSYSFHIEQEKADVCSAIAL